MKCYHVLCKWQQKLLAACICFVLSISIMYAEEVSKFAYKRKPEHFHQQTMQVPHKTVALSEYQYVPGATDLSNDTLYQPSLMFVIDYSASMNSNDPENARIIVPSNLLDTLMKECPLAEVGIALWAGQLKFDRSDDPYKVICPGEPGGYCPLFQLNKTYPPDNKTGYEILKWYLRLTSTGRLAYFQGNIVLNGTNVTTGINASKHAFTNTERDKSRHFNIFFSDGAPNKPQNDPLAFVSGEDVATTFTVFFGASSAPQCLEDFTANVKANGYSGNNPKSDLWSIANVGQDTLMSFLMNNVINQILKTGYTVPFKMAVNGGNPVENWLPDSIGFTFPKLFPLKGWTTDFVFDIDYHKRRIYVDPSTGIIDTVDIDTTHHIEFEVTIDDNQGPLPDSLWDVKHWDRELNFYHNDQIVTLIKDEMNPLELRFTYDPGEAKYEYSKTKIEVRNSAGSAQDKESIDLKKSGQTFTGTFKREIIDDNSQPNVGDGTLQHYQNDQIIAVFRNDETPQLILDTLMIKVPFEFSGAFELSKAYYYDNSADGYVDSIVISYTTSMVEEITKDHVKEIVDNALDLPGFREYTVTDYDVFKDHFYLIVEEGTGHNPFTYVTKDDILDFENYTFTTGGMVMAKKVKAIDKVAPIIHWEPRSAFLTDYMDSAKTDILKIVFSEPVEKVTADKPFYFLALKDNKQYEVTLKDIEQPEDNKMIFEVIDFTEVTFMEEGDSVWIRETDRVGDREGNYQNNKRNTKRKLYVDRIPMPFTLIPKAVTPLKLKELTEEYKVPKEIKDVLDIEGILEDLQLFEDDNQYHGMIIMAVPDPEDIGVFMPDLTCKGSISIFDPVGNQVIEDLPMAWWDERKSLVTVWNVKNQNQRTVGSGTYVAIMQIDVSNITSRLISKMVQKENKLLLGVRE